MTYFLLQCPQAEMIVSFMFNIVVGLMVKGNLQKKRRIYRINAVINILWLTLHIGRFD